MLITSLDNERVKKYIKLKEKNIVIKQENLLWKVHT